MAKTIRVSDEFHELITAHKREDETMDEALKRMVGGPDPRIQQDLGIIGDVDDESAAAMQDAIDRKRDRGRDRRDDLRECRE